MRNAYAVLHNSLISEPSDDDRYYRIVKTALCGDRDSSRRSADRSAHTPTVPRLNHVHACLPRVNTALPSINPSVPRFLKSSSNFSTESTNESQRFAISATIGAQSRVSQFDLPNVERVCSSIHIFTNRRM